MVTVPIVNRNCHCLGTIIQSGGITLRRRPVCALLLCLLLTSTLVPRALAIPPIPPPAVTGHWAKPEIIDAYELGLIDTWPGNPDEPVTRRQAARFLADGLGLTPVVGELPFIDVAGDDPDREWLVAAYRGGIFLGDDLGLFRPEQPLTRAEFAAIIARAGTGLLAEQQETAAFSDLTGHWAQREVGVACRLGLVQGVGDGLFDPGRSVTLAEVLVMVVRLIDGTQAPGAVLAADEELVALAVLDLELWAKAYSQTPMPDWTDVCANRVGVALYIMKESAALEDAYRRQGHSGSATVRSASGVVMSKKPLSAVVTMESSGISVWDGVATEITEVTNVFLRRVRGRWMIYKSLGR